jgi:hypothetical protein
MNIIGLGKAGCAIAKAIAEYPEYRAYMIDNGAKGVRCFDFPLYEHPEEYENSTPDMTEFFQDVEGEVVFVLSGASKISGACLKIMQHLKDHKITIIYIKPNLDTLEDVKVKMHRVCFGVLQEYARSAVFERIIIIENNSVESILGEIPIMGYYDSLNKTIIETFHMLNVLSNSEPVMGKVNNTREASRISTIGTVDIDSGEEKMFFSLDNIREKCYFYNIKGEDLRTDGNLLKTITRQVNELKSEDSRSSYAIYSSKYDQNYIFSFYHTPYVQLEGE